MKKSIILFVVLIGAFLAGTGIFSDKAQAEGQDVLKDAITKAAVQCYAIEGYYPPSIQYLEEHYDIRIDKTRYSVMYNGFASNVMPDITVLSVEE